MWTTVPRAPQISAAAPPGAEDQWAADLAGASDPVSVRSLGRDLVTLLLQHSRRSGLPGWKTVRSLTASGAGVWRCAAELALVLVLSCALVLLAWDSTESQRRPDAASAGSAEDQLQESLVDDEPSIDVEVRRGRAPGVVDRVPAKNAAGGAGAGDSASGGLLGWFLSFAAVSAVLVAGLSAAMLVLWRHRRDRGQRSEQAELPVLHDVRELPCAELPDVAVDEAGSQPGEEGDRTREQDTRPGPGALATLDTVNDASTAAPSRSAEQAGPAASSTGSAFVPNGLLEGGAGVDVGEPEPPGGRAESGERLFERREAPRVAYERPGELEWRGVRRDMTVRDLSGRGLRFHVVPAEGSPLPTSGDFVWVTFPVVSGQVRVTAQVAWRRTVLDGTEFGIVFRPQSAEDCERIRQTCLAAMDLG